jgi:hypothetical protein
MDATLVEQVEVNHLFLEQGHHLAMRQGADRLQVLLVLQGLSMPWLPSRPTRTTEPGLG